MNIEHHYIEKGEGFPLVLLHGNGENNEYFKHQIEYFSKEYRVIALDTRGHGKTDRGDAAFTLSQFAEDLKKFLDSKNITKAIILGFSDGGNIALLFTLKYQGYVKTLIIDGANINPDGVKKSVQIPIKIGYSITKFFARYSKRALANNERLKLMTHEPNIAPEMLGAISVPVLVMAGNKDIIKDSHTKEIFKSLPNAKLAIITGDHFIAAKKSVEFNESVDRFLKLSDNI